MPKIMFFVHTKDADRFASKLREHAVETPEVGFIKGDPTRRLVVFTVSAKNEEYFRTTAENEFGLSGYTTPNSIPCWIYTAPP